MSRALQQKLAFAFGVSFVITILVLAVAFPEPTQFQYTVFRIVLALAAGGVAAMFPGFLSITLSTWLRAGGALAVFAIVYFYPPANMVGVKAKTSLDIEIEKPLIQVKDAPAPVPQPKKELEVRAADDLMKDGVLDQRYDVVTINGVKARVPVGAAIVSETIDGQKGGALVGDSFSVVANRLSNLTIDVESNPAVSPQPGSVFVYSKQVQNARFVARGQDGKPGKDGQTGATGSNGGNGANGSCGPGVLGQFTSSSQGGNGGDGGPGGDGSPGTDGSAGGRVLLVTLANPIGTEIDVKGGTGGPGGKGAPGGQGGTGGLGGSGCTGVGGNQPTRPNGQPGKRGADGKDGPSGNPGSAGDYRLLIVASFDPVSNLLANTPPQKLHSALQAQFH